MNLGKNDNSPRSLAFLSSVFVVGLILVPVLVLQPNFIPTQISIRHGLAGGFFMTICGLGILAVFYPTKCRSMFSKSQNPMPKVDKSLVKIRGHHPDCQKYSSNRIEVWGKAICAACGGLLIGAMAVLIGSVLYFFLGYYIVLSNIWLLLLGEIAMLLGLTQIKFTSYVKVFANMIFVIGSFVTLVEADSLGESLLVDFYVVGLIAFALWFRILLSEWNNRRICKACQTCF
jgi:hypothetical protein